MKKSWHRGELTVQIETTNNCNFKCIMCGRTSNPPKKLCSMTFPAFQKLMRQLRTLPIKTFVGHNLGEPLLTPRYIDMLEHFDKVYHGRKFIMNTNASRLNGDFTQRFLKLANNRYELNFSLDAIRNSTYMKIHKKKFGPIKQNVVNFLKAFLLAAPQNITVVLNFIVSPHNINEQKKFIDHWKPYLKLNDHIKIRCKPLAWTPGLRRMFNYPAWTNAHPDASIIDPTRPRKKQCRHPWKMLSVRANGDVGICCYSMNGEHTIGNFLKVPVPRLVLGRRLKIMRAAFAKRDFQKHPLCYFCHA